mmetsp:Transcript_107368/g.213147  ORF Transcript_107368/g.213147 Transcript_107368/m.213147 type:complete len:530 (-) Transcript_107368:239-1828(-)
MQHVAANFKQRRRKVLVQCGCAVLGASVVIQIVALNSPSQPLFTSGSGSGLQRSGEQDLTETQRAWFWAARCVAADRPDAPAYLEAAWHQTEAWWLRPLALTWAILLGLGVRFYQPAPILSKEDQRRLKQQQQQQQQRQARLRQGSEQALALGGQLAEADAQDAVRALQRLELPFFATSGKSVDRPVSGIEIRGNPRGNALQNWKAARSVLEAQLSTALNCSVVVHLVQVEEERATMGQKMFDLFVTQAPKETVSSGSVMLSASSLLLSIACVMNFPSSTMLHQLGAVIAPDSQMPVGVLFCLLAVGELARYVSARNVGVHTKPPIFLPSPQIGVLGTLSGVQTPCPSRAAALMVALAAPLSITAGSLICLALAAAMPLSTDEWQALHTLPQVTMPAWPLALFGSTLHPLKWAGVHGLVMASLALLPHSPDGHIVWSCLHGRSFAKRLGNITLLAFPIIGVLFSSADTASLTTLPLMWTFFLINFSTHEQEMLALEEVSEVPLAGRLLGYSVLAAAAMGAWPVPLSSLA